MPKTYLNYINGQWVPSVTGKTSPNVNPANTEEIVGYFQHSGTDDAESAIRAAADALAAWRALPVPTRGTYLFKVARAMERRLDEIARAMTLEEGKTLSESIGEVKKGIDIFDFYAGESRRMKGETSPSETANVFAYTVRQPLGVVALITPWNFPVSIPCWKMAPALVTGNTVVFKPASLTPWTALLITECVAEAGLPAGVVNLITGPGSTLGDYITSHKTIRAVSFTGSNGIGEHIHELAVKHNAKVQLEMGGKNPIIVLDDADLNLAVTGTVAGAFGATGQRCTAASRVIVVESLLEEFTRRVVEETKKWTPGPGLEGTSSFGPMVDASSLKTALHYVEVGQKEGGRLLCGGNQLTDGDYAKGFFIAPTVFDNVTTKMTIAQEEIFAPVLVIMAAKDFAEALEIANDVQFGLSASIYTRDLNVAQRFIDGVEAGVVHINQPTYGGEVQLPFGGMKGSGSGGRELGTTAIEFFTEWKTVYVDYRTVG